MTPSTQSQNACQEKKEFWRWHTINFLHLCQKLSSCLLTRLKWSQKPCQAAEEKALQRELISKTQKYVSHF